jgi:uncharacterized protein (TIGR03437 family)
VAGRRADAHAALLISFCAPRPIAQTQTDNRFDISETLSRKHGIEGEWGAEERARELDLWHELNRRRFARTHPLGADVIGAEATVIDVDGISIIQDDGTLAISENFFDLQGRAVQFAPAGSSYVITSFSAAFDTNLGVKLDLTRPPAINAVEPGDDAFIMQDLGFSFNFYGASYSMVAVTSNGNLTFRPTGVTDAFFNTNSVDSGESLTDLQTTLPRIAPYAVVSAASYTQTLAPGGIAAIIGFELADGTAVASSQPLPETLAGAQVLVNGTPAPLFFASPGQINFQLPRDAPATTNNRFTQFIPSGAVTVEVVRNGERIRAGVFQVAPSVPSVFTLDQSGTGPAAALDAFTFSGPPFNATLAGGEPNVIALFGTGLGADATDADGDVSASVQARIDGNPAQVLFAGRAPGFIGLNQLNLMLTPGIAPGIHTVIFTRNGVTSSPATIAIK